MHRISIRGVKVYPFASVDELLALADRQKGVLVAINADKVIWATDRTRRIINDNIGYCDGAGAVTALRKRGAKDVIRIPGCELWLEMIDRWHATKTFYIIGASRNINDQTVRLLQSRYPDIRIVGHRDGYLRDQRERQALIDDVADKCPDVVFVAMGSPKQELLMADLAERHRAIYQGLGGSFDVFTGHQTRAPRWMQRLGIEFMYRLIIRPKRIKRDIHKMRFAWWLITDNF